MATVDARSGLRRCGLRLEYATLLERRRVGGRAGRSGLLATAVLGGLILNAAAGLWWADPVAASVLVYYGAREGWHALHASVA